MECSTLAHLRRVIAEAQATIAQAQAQIDLIEAEDAITAKLQKEVAR
jgi:hypothetical protein